MRMQLETGEVGEPHQRRGVARHDLLGRAARGEAQRDHLDPGRPRFRRALLEEELAADPVGVAYQYVGPAPGPTQRAVGDGDVVAYEIELRVLRLRDEHLGRVRGGDLPSR